MIAILELSTRGLPRSDGKFKPAEPSMMSRQSLCATPEPGPESPSACMFEWLQNVESHTSSDTHFGETAFFMKKHKTRIS